MRYISLVAIIVSSFYLVSCEVESEVAPEEIPVEIIDGEERIANALLQGSFEGTTRYNVEGIVAVVEEEGIKKLQLRDFKTSNGPDLRIYLAEDVNATNFIEISNQVRNGSHEFNLDESINLTSHNTILIWCKAFSVRFGHAKLE